MITKENENGTKVSASFFKVQDLLLYLRLVQYYGDDLHIITMHIASSLYSQSIRELRFLLESFAQGY